MTKRSDIGYLTNVVASFVSRTINDMKGGLTCTAVPCLKLFSPHTDNPTLAMVYDWYQSCIDEKKRDEVGATPLLEVKPSQPIVLFPDDQTLTSLHMTCDVIS